VIRESAVSEAGELADALAAERALSDALAEALRLYEYRLECAEHGDGDEIGPEDRAEARAALSRHRASSGGGQVNAHTKGPWTASPPWGKPNGGRSIEAHGGDSTVADVYAGHHPDDCIGEEEGEANARLIASAPALLAACEAALADTESIKFRDDIARWHKQMRAAVAKAREG